MCSSHFLVGSDFSRSQQELRGLIGLQCVFVCACLGKLRPPKALGFRGQWRAYSCCCHSLPMETLGTGVVPSGFITRLSSLLHLRASTLETRVISGESEAAPATRCHQQPKACLSSFLDLMLMPTERIAGVPGLPVPMSVNVCVTLSKRD